MAIKKEELNKFNFFKEFYSYKTLTSTNETAKKFIQGNTVPSYFVISSEIQTQGKGRWGRKWFSYPGGLWCSLVLPKTSVPSLRATFSVIQTIRQLTPLTPGIRWPNDIIIKNKKAGGVITESESGKLVIGVGVNINQENFPPELRDATSLYIELGKSISIRQFLFEFIENFEKNLLIDEIIDKIR